MKIVRLLDTGVRTAAENMALDRAVLRARNRGLVPDTVRFLMFSPTAVLVGYHQCVEQEIRVEYCHERGFDINRRITGGGGLFFNEHQLGWELIAAEETVGLSPNLIPIYRKICSAAVAGLKRLGIRAEFRPRNDIEVEGRKISGTGGAQEGNAFLFQGTLLLDFDIPSMLRALMIPVEKIQGKGINNVADRMTWVARELGYMPPLEEIKSAMAAGFEKAFGWKLEPGGLTDDEHALFEEELPYFQSDAWIRRITVDKTRVETYDAVHKASGGLIRAALRVDEKRTRLLSAMVTGDFFIYPSRFIYDLECALRDIRADEATVERVVEEQWHKTQPRATDLGANDFAEALNKALEKSRYKTLGFTPNEANRIFTIKKSLFELLEMDIPLLLLPYCSKLATCKYRKIDACIECGQCTIGDAYAMGREAHMDVKSILSFEHLMEELLAARERGVPAFIGSCCKAFYKKHYRDFIEADVPGILIDIDSATCYDLGKEHNAYAGAFKSQTHLNLPLIKKMMKLIKSLENTIS